MPEMKPEKFLHLKKVFYGDLTSRGQIRTLVMRLMNVVLKIPPKIPFLLPKTQPKPQTIFDARFLRRLYCVGMVVVAGVLLMYWKMTFCPKFIRCFGLLFVLKLEIFKTQFYLIRDKSWVGLD